MKQLLFLLKAGLRVMQNFGQKAAFSKICLHTLEHGAIGRAGTFCTQASWKAETGKGSFVLKQKSSSVLPLRKTLIREGNPLFIFSSVILVDYKRLKFPCLDGFA